MKRALELCRRLCTEAGFDPEFADDMMLGAAIRRRLLATGIPEAEGYSRRLCGERAEREALLEELLVRESWFFRDQAPFQLLGELAPLRWPERSAERPLAVLSAPCAGGEEPYSIAMALAGAGFAATDYRIEAIDLSRRGLEMARRACYRPSAVRQVPGTLAGEYLDVLPDGMVEVRASLRETVRLHHGNLLSLPETLREQRFDVIFCRNVLIYLATAAREQVLSQLDAMLASDGLLVLGHAEPGLLAGRGFEPAGTAGAFAFERRRDLPAADQPKPGPQAPRTRTPERVRTRTVVPVVQALPDAPPPPMPALAEEVRGIRELADAGAYPEAGRRAEDLIAAKPACADAHYLLGLIRAAEGRSAEARRALERAAYLEPRHASALRHLALLLEASGDRNGATRMRQRAERSGSGLQ